MTPNDDLFSWTPPAKYPERPGFKEPTTSRDAAEKIAPIAATLRGQVLQAYEVAWPAGLTADEVAGRLGKSILSIRPRVTELRKTGKLYPCLLKGGEAPLRRKNDSGLEAVVLVCKKPEEK